jgi:hypothetical protein
MRVCEKPVDGGPRTPVHGKAGWPPQRVSKGAERPCDRDFPQTAARNVVWLIAV